ncbi:MAG TPA: dethiobiotin synthase [Gemmatimonadales bacterium]|nr:dethiobiotin synthase [Gemmatimonadales bacterium]
MGAPSPGRTTVLVTGTDTGVGKTWAGCALAHALRAVGRRVIAVKPVESGCGDSGAEPAAGEDGERLAAATGQAAPRRALRRFRAAIAPAAAADLESGNPSEAAGTLELDQIAAEIEAAAGDADVLLVEGAGGLLSPMAWDWTAVDLARTLDASALVIASDRLGTINHTLLTLSALDLAGVRVAGVVLSAPAAPDASTGGNAAAIMRLSGIDRVRAVPRVDDPAAAAEWFGEVVSWL